MKISLSIDHAVFGYYRTQKHFDEFTPANFEDGAIPILTSQSKSKYRGKVLYTVQVDYVSMLELTDRSKAKPYTLSDVSRLVQSAKGQYKDLIRIKNFDDNGTVGEIYLALNPDKIEIKHRSK